MRFSVWEVLAFLRSHNTSLFIHWKYARRDVSRPRKSRFFPHCMKSNLRKALFKNCIDLHTLSPFSHRGGGNYSYVKNMESSSSYTCKNYFSHLHGSSWLKQYSFVKTKPFCGVKIAALLLVGDICEKRWTTFAYRCFYFLQKRQYYKLKLQ